MSGCFFLKHGVGSSPQYLWPSAAVLSETPIDNISQKPRFAAHITLLQSTHFTCIQCCTRYTCSDHQKFFSGCWLLSSSVWCWSQPLLQLPGALRPVPFNFTETPRVLNALGYWAAAALRLNSVPCSSHFHYDLMTSDYLCISMSVNIYLVYTTHGNSLRI